MSSMAGNSESTSNDELKARLEAIAKKNRDLVLLFASRCALRVLPYVASGGTFGIWDEKDQAKHLSVLWFAASLGYTLRPANLSPAARAAAFSAANSVDASDAADAADAAHAAAYSAAAAYAFSAANTNAYATHADADTDAVCCAAVAADAYADNYTYIYASATDLNRSVYIDLAVLESSNPEELYQLPLWIEGQPKSQNVVLISWVSAVEQLGARARAEGHPLGELISSLPAHYSNIVAGNYSRERATAVAQELYEYFSTLESDDKKESLKQKPARKKGVKKERPETAKTQSENHTLKSNESSEPKPKVATLPSNTLATENPSDEDHLGRENIYTALAAILADPNNNGHQTIGLLGDWGSGKSTWINLLEAQLDKYKETQPFLISKFNAWSYENTPNLQAGIAHELIKALVKQPKAASSLAGWWWSLRLKGNVADAIHGRKKMVWLAVNFLVAILPFGILLSLLPSPQAGADSLELLGLGMAKWSGMAATIWLIYKNCAEQWKSIWATPQAKELLTYLKLPDYAKHLGEIPVMRKTLEKFCDVRLKQMSESTVEEGHTRLIVVVDDLDRCGHQQIVKVFEAVRLVLEIEHVTVIIAVDQHIALAALALHYKDLASHHKLANPRAIARDYLAKVIHLPITISAPDDDGVESMLNNIWAKAEASAEKGAGVPKENINRSVDDFPVGKNINHKATQVIPGHVTNTSTALEVNESDVKLTIGEHASKNTGVNLKEELSKNEHAKERGVVQAQEVPPRRMLKAEQKAAFLAWVKFFSLSNPRQLKRLNNTYSLILNANSQFDTDVLVVKSEFGEQQKAFSYPVLIALISIEYLNALDDAELRKYLKARLQGREVSLPKAGEGVPSHKITEEFIDFFIALNTLSPLNLFKEVEPFVLPAIECDMAPAKPAIRPIDKTESSAEFA